MKNIMQVTKESLLTLLHEGVCKVTFTKINGEKRIMPCTLKASLLPPLPVKLVEPPSHQVGMPDPATEVLKVFCIDKQAFRSFRIANVTDIEVIEE